jgi:hypothetical protein
MQLMMSKIRNLMQTMGFKSKPGVNLRLAYDNSPTPWPAALERQNHHGEGATQQSGRHRDTLVEDELPTTLYGCMNFCVMCGQALELLVLDVKECPDLHGKVYGGSNQKGLPTIVFEPAQEVEEEWYMEK